MAASQPDTTTDDTTPDVAPGEYRRADPTGLGDRRWVHDRTGLAVDLFRYARHKTAGATGVPDSYEYQLVIRPDGVDGGGQRVRDEIWDADVAVTVARDWMREHPSGTFEGGDG